MPQRYEKTRNLQWYKKGDVDFPHIHFRTSPWFSPVCEQAPSSIQVEKHDQREIPMGVSLWVLVSPPWILCQITVTTVDLRLVDGEIAMLLRPALAAEDLRTLIEAQSFSLKEKAVFPYSGLTPIDIAFYIAPLINAITRVGSIEEKELMFYRDMKTVFYIWLI